MCKEKSPIILFYDFALKQNFIDEITSFKAKFRYELLWFKPDYVAPLTTNFKPVKDLEAILVFGLTPSNVNYYPPKEECLSKEDFPLKYAVWCKSSSEIGENTKIIDYAEALEKVLKGDPEYLAHVRFSNIPPSPSRSFVYSSHFGTSLQYTLKLLKEDGAYIKDGMIYVRRKSSGISKKVSSLFTFETKRHPLHPTQKPVELMKKLVSLYSKERRHSA